MRHEREQPGVLEAEPQLNGSAPEHKLTTLYVEATLWVLLMLAGAWVALEVARGRYNANGLWQNSGHSMTGTP